MVDTSIYAAIYNFKIFRGRTPGPPALRGGEGRGREGREREGREGKKGEGSLLLREGKGREGGKRGRGGEGEGEGKGRREREREREIFAGPMSNCFRRPDIDLALTRRMKCELMSYQLESITFLLPFTLSSTC